MVRPPAFHFHNGRSARNAADLLVILEEGPASLYGEHVTPTRNDFAAWAEHGIHERALAARLRESAGRDETIAALRSWLEPHAHRARTLGEHSRREFLLGVGLGIIIGVIVAGVIGALV